MSADSDARRRLEILAREVREAGADAERRRAAHASGSAPLAPATAVVQALLAGRTRIAIAGQPGVGKTTLLRDLRSRLASSFGSVYLPVPDLAPQEIRAWIASTEGPLPADAGTTLEDLAAAHARRSAGLVLLIDDAHGMPREIAEALDAILQRTRLAMRLVLAGLDDPRFDAVLGRFSEPFERIVLESASVSEVLRNIAAPTMPPDVPDASAPLDVCAPEPADAEPPPPPAEAHAPSATEQHEIESEQESEEAWAAAARSEPKASEVLPPPTAHADEAALARSESGAERGAEAESEAERPAAASAPPLPGWGRPARDASQGWIELQLHPPAPAAEAADEAAPAAAGEDAPPGALDESAVVPDEVWTPGERVRTPDATAVAGDGEDAPPPRAEAPDAGVLLPVVVAPSPGARGAGAGARALAFALAAGVVLAIGIAIGRWSGRALEETSAQEAPPVVARAPVPDAPAAVEAPPAAASDPGAAAAPAAPAQPAASVAAQPAASNETVADAAEPAPPAPSAGGSAAADAAPGAGDASRVLAALDADVAAPPPAAEPAVTLVAVHVNARPWARVEVDGRALGLTPLGNVPLRPGTHRFRAELADGRVVERDVHVDANNRQVTFP